MRYYIEKTRFEILRRALCLIVAVTFGFNCVLPSAALAQNIGQTVLNLPMPGTMVNLSPAFNPIMVRGLTLYPDNPLKFDFIIDRGQEDLNAEAFKEESEKIIKYFLASLTVPEDQMWVNLSPYEKNRIIPEVFGKTEMGRDLLAQDYMLKQLTASLVYPEEGLGKEFWSRVYKKSQEKFGNTEIPMNTFNKIWIVPDKASIYEHEKGAFIVNSHLKVMLEEDYLALESNKNSNMHGLGDLKKDDLEIVSGVSSDIVREVLIPEIEKEVNEGKTFANLRQIYNASILASWYKKNLKQSLLGQVYVDQGRTTGINLSDPNINQEIYDQYVESFKKGVYDYIKEDMDEATGEIIPRKYFSGGIADLRDVPTEKAVLGAAFDAAQNVDEAQTVSFELTDPAQVQKMAGVKTKVEGILTGLNRPALIEGLSRQETMRDLSAFISAVTLSFEASPFGESQAAVTQLKLVNKTLEFDRASLGELMNELVVLLTKLNISNTVINPNDFMDKYHEIERLVRKALNENKLSRQDMQNLRQAIEGMAGQFGDEHLKLKIMAQDLAQEIKVFESVDAIEEADISWLGLNDFDEIDRNEFRRTTDVARVDAAKVKNIQDAVKILRYETKSAMDEAIKFAADELRGLKESPSSIQVSAAFYLLKVYDKMPSPKILEALTKINNTILEGLSLRDPNVQVTAAAAVQQTSRIKNETLTRGYKKHFKQAKKIIINNLNGKDVLPVVRFKAAQHIVNSKKTVEEVRRLYPNRFGRIGKFITYTKPQIKKAERIVEQNKQRRLSLRSPGDEARTTDAGRLQRFTLALDKFTNAFIVDVGKRLGPSAEGAFRRTFNETFPNKVALQGKINNFYTLGEDTPDFDELNYLLDNEKEIEYFIAAVTNYLAKDINKEVGRLEELVYLSLMNPNEEVNSGITNHAKEYYRSIKVERRKIKRSKIKANRQPQSTHVESRGARVDAAKMPTSEELLAQGISPFQDNRFRTIFRIAKREDDSGYFIQLGDEDLTDYTVYVKDGTVTEARKLLPGASRERFQTDGQIQDISLLHIFQTLINLRTNKEGSLLGDFNGMSVYFHAHAVQLELSLFVGSEDQTKIKARIPRQQSHRTDQIQIEVEQRGAWRSLDPQKDRVIYELLTTMFRNTVAVSEPSLTQKVISAKLSDLVNRSPHQLKDPQQRIPLEDILQRLNEIDASSVFIKGHAKFVKFQQLVNTAKAQFADQKMTEAKATLNQLLDFLRDEFAAMQRSSIPRHYLNFDGITNVIDNIENIRDSVDAARATDEVKIEVDAAKGGIDLNPNEIKMEIQRNGNGVIIPVLREPIENYKDLPGFLPVIINIAPINNLPLSLGLSTAAPKETLSSL